MSSSKAYTLHYFNARGRAETSRLILVQAGQEYEDRRHTSDEWPKLKPQMPLGQVPVLEIDKEKLPQSLAIARYLARQFKLVGKDDLEAAKCDAIVDTIQEITETYFRAWFHTKDEKQQKDEQIKFTTDTLPQKLRGLETLMSAYGDGTWMVGSNVTWADLAVYDGLQNMLAIDAEVLDKYPKLKTNREAVEKLPKIADYLKDRKETQI